MQGFFTTAFVFPSSVWGQTGSSGALAEVVTDRSRTVIPGVTVHGRGKPHAARLKVSRERFDSEILRTVVVEFSL